MYVRMYVETIDCLWQWAFAFEIESVNCFVDTWTIPDSKVHGANMGPIRGRQDPGGPHVGPMHFAIWDGLPMSKY